jgi:hypothetical protein
MVAIRQQRLQRSNSGRPFVCTLPERVDCQFNQATASLAGCYRFLYAITLAAVIFLPSASQSDFSRLTTGLHETFLVLGIFTIVSSGIFRHLRKSDGENETGQKIAHLD